MTHCSEKARKASIPGLILVALGLAALGAGCGQGTCRADRQLGSCCATDKDCDGDLTCLTRFPAGLCSHDCEEDHLCPADARCIHIISKSKGDLGHACLKLCGPEYDACRGDYSCAGTSEPDLKVCFPG